MYSWGLWVWQGNAVSRPQDSPRLCLLSLFCLSAKPLQMERKPLHLLTPSPHVYWCGSWCSSFPTSWNAKRWNLSDLLSGTSWACLTQTRIPGEEAAVPFIPSTVTVLGHQMAFSSLMNSQQSWQMVEEDRAGTEWVIKELCLSVNLLKIISPFWNSISSSPEARKWFGMVVVTLRSTNLLKMCAELCEMIMGRFLKRVCRAFPKSPRGCCYWLNCVSPP